LNKIIATHNLQKSQSQSFEAKESDEEDFLKELDEKQVNMSQEHERNGKIVVEYEKLQHDYSSVTSENAHLKSEKQNLVNIITSLEEQLEKLKEEKDESLKKYLISLGMDPNYDPPKDDIRRVVISEFAIIFKDHDNVQKWTFATPEDLKKVKKNPLVIKEKAEYKFRVTFRVQHNVVLGLQMNNTVFSKIKEVKDHVMFGSYPPSNEFKSFDFPTDGWHEAPSGLALRGEYKARMQFTDDDGADHLTFDYCIKIAKDWKD